MSCSSSVSGSGILLYHSGSTTRWQVEQARVPSHAPGEDGRGGGWEREGAEDGSEKGRRMGARRGGGWE